MKTAYQIKPRSLAKPVKPVRNPDYLKFVRSQYCCVSGRNWGVEACHTGAHGLRQKASDLDAIPLIRELHSTGPYALDTIGRAAFERHFNIDIQQIIRALLIRAEAAGVVLIPPEKSK